MFVKNFALQPVVERVGPHALGFALPFRAAIEKLPGMAVNSGSLTETLFLGIEGGGTHTVALMADAAGRVVHRVEAGPANLRLVDDSHLERHFRSLAKSFPKPSALGIGMAGVRDARDHGRILKAADKVWPRVPCEVSHDLETALLAAGRCSDRTVAARVIVLSGTGSCCYGGRPDGRTAKVGGWGHLLGDKGSGYEIGLRALKAIIYYYDRDGVWSGLGQRILRTLALNEPNDLIGWAQAAAKSDIAALAIEVFAAWKKKDKIAADILTGASSTLAKDAVACARRLVKPNSQVQFVLTGSVLLKQPLFARNVSREIARLWPKADSLLLEVESVWGAVELAKKASDSTSARHPTKTALTEPSVQPKDKDTEETLIPESSALSPTEQRNKASLGLDRLPVGKAIELMLSQEAFVPQAILKEQAKIEKTIGWTVRAFRSGGRLFYVGAGTSGRLGVLDASECPPTFRTDPEQVQAIIAGGQTAIWKAAEGAEDDREAGARAIDCRNVGKRDVVIGIAASGRTPFVWAALDAARRRGAKTVLLCFNPYLKFRAGQRPDLVIVPDIGPEVLTGSTRLKAGTATKLVLNLITTLSMVRLGKVASNLMIDLNPSNTKLRHRAVRILQQLTDCEASAAKAALEESGWVVKDAWRKLRAR